MAYLLVAVDHGFIRKTSHDESVRYDFVEVILLGKESPFGKMMWRHTRG